MIEVMLKDALSAHVALQRIGKAELTPKGSYRVGALIRKLRAESALIEETQLRLLRANGGVDENGSVSIKQPARKDGESDEDLAAREAEHQARLKTLTEGVKAVLDDKVKIDYDPIPLSMFEVPDPDDPKKERMKSTISPNDMSFVIDFVDPEK